MEIRNTEIPSHIHAKIMKRVFIAGYGKYLALSGTVLVINLSVLGRDLYKAFKTDGALYQAIPVPSMVVASLLVTISIYVTITILRTYKNSSKSGLFVRE